MHTIAVPKTLGIRYPKWFYKSLEALHSNQSVRLKGLNKKTKITGAGWALMELLRWEAKAKQLRVSGIKATLKLPLHQEGRSLGWFEKSLQPLFFERFAEINSSRMDEDLRYDLELLFNELTQNALDHSGSERFLVLLELRSIAVFDLGVSIPAKLEQSYRFKNDIEALENAQKKGVTTRRDRPGGFGLYYTLAQLKNRGGYLFIASRAGQIRRYLKNKKIERKNIRPGMPGTLIYCQLGVGEKE